MVKMVDTGKTGDETSDFDQLKVLFKEETHCDNCDKKGSCLCDKD